MNESRENLKMKITARPRIYITPDNIEYYKQKRKHKPFDFIFEQMIIEAEKWAKTELPDEPRNFPQPPTFKYGEKFDGEILAEITERTQYMVRPAILSNGFLYQITGNKKYATETRRWLMHACRWDIEGSSGVWGNDIQAATMGMAMACGYDWIHDTLSEDEQQIVRETLVARAEQMCHFLTPIKPIYNGEYCNHAWMDAGCAILCGIAVFDEIPEAADWIKRMVAMFEDDFLTKGYADGSWHEYSYYWKTAFLYGVCFTADPLRDCFGINLYDNDWLKNSGEYVITSIAKRPDLRFGFGDSHYRPDWQEFLAFEKWANEYSRPEGRWSYAKYYNDPEMWQGHPFSYLWISKNHEIKKPSWNPKKKYESGEVFLRSSWDEDAITVGFKAGPYVGYEGYSHGHGDQNSFTLNAYGERLLIDAGVYDYWGSNHYSKFYTTSKAHNTILIDGKGQLAMTPQCQGEILEFKSENNCDYIRAQAAEAYGNPDLNSFIRELWFVENKYIVIRDSLESIRSMDFTWLFHSLYPMSIKDNQVTIKGQKAGAMLKFNVPQQVDMKISENVVVPPTIKLDNAYKEYHLELELKANANIVLMTTIVPYKISKENH